MIKKQVVVIHGGDTFETYEKYIAFLKSYEIDSLDYFTHKGWKSGLQQKLGNDFQVIAPEMPNPTNAKYLEWEIWFEKLIPLLSPKVILVGHSMGGIFLAKYLSENDFPKKIAGAFLVSAPYENNNPEESYVDFILPASLEKFEGQSEKIYLYHSTDDDVVLFTELEKYKKKLPSATPRVFENRGHFNQEEFPELVQDILLLGN